MADQVRPHALWAARSSNNWYAHCLCSACSATLLLVVGNDSQIDPELLLVLTGTFGQAPSCSDGGTLSSRSWLRLTFSSRLLWRQTSARLRLPCNVYHLEYVAHDLRWAMILAIGYADIFWVLHLLVCLAQVCTRCHCSIAAQHVCDSSGRSFDISHAAFLCCTRM